MSWMSRSATAGTGRCGARPTPPCPSRWRSSCCTRITPSAARRWPDSAPRPSTPGYLAPERAMGEQATPASDLYSLGMVAYECLAGTPPFRGTALEVALAHRDRPLPPLPPTVNAGVCALVMWLAAKDPARRLNDAAEVAVWAGLLRDGVGVADLPMWPEMPG